MPPAYYSEQANPHRQRIIHSRDSALIAANHERGRTLRRVRWSLFMAGVIG